MPLPFPASCFVVSHGLHLHTWEASLGEDTTAATTATAESAWGWGMDSCQQEEKGRVIFVTREDHETGSGSELVVDNPNEDHGLILTDEDINWNCPS